MERAVGCGELPMMDTTLTAPEPPEGRPLAVLINEQRRRHSLSLAGVARRMREAAQGEGDYCGADRRAIHGYERGRIPHPDALRWLAAALEAPLDRVVEAAGRQRRIRDLRRMIELKESDLFGSSPWPPVPGMGHTDDDVERRELLRLLGAGTGGVAALGVLGSTAARGLGLAWPGAPGEVDPLEGILSVTRHYRRLRDTVPSRSLLPPVLGHLELISDLLSSSNSEITQAGLTAAANVTASLAGRLAVDLGDLAGFRRHYRSALAHAQASGDDQLRAYTLGSMSYWMGVIGNGQEAVLLAERAQRLMPGDAPPAAKAWLETFEARARSRVGDTAAALGAMDRAEAALTESPAEEQPLSPWPALYRRGLARHRGGVATNLGLPEMARSAFQQGLEGPLPPLYRACALCDLAASHVQVGEVEEACRLAGEAFEVGVAMGSHRTVRHVRKVRDQLDPQKAMRAVRELDERLLASLLPA